MKPIISIIIPAFCKPEILLRCLNGIGQQSYPLSLIELVVVDDCAPFDLQMVVDDFRRQFIEFKTVLYQRNEVNSGRAVTRNKGIASASGNVIFFLDVDNVLEPGCCQCLADYFCDPEALLAVRCNIRSSDDALKNSAYVRFFNSRYLGQRKAHELAGIDFEALPSKFFATDAVAVSRKAITLVGGFDERFSEYGCEDEDMGIRLVEQGAVFKFGSLCHVIDSDVPTIRRACERMVVYASSSVPKLLSKHPSYRSHTLFSMLEQPFNALTAKQKVLSVGLKLGARNAFARAVLHWLERKDKQSSFKGGFFYKFVLTSFYVQGMRVRERS